MEPLDGDKMDQKRSTDTQSNAFENFGGFGGFGTPDNSKMSTGGFGGFGTPDNSKMSTGGFGGFGTPDSSTKSTGGFGGFGTPDSSTKSTGGFGGFGTPVTNNNNNNNSRAPQQEEDHRQAKHRRDEPDGILQPTRLVFGDESSAGQRFPTVLPDHEKLIRENERLRVENERLKDSSDRATMWARRLQEESDHQHATALQTIERLNSEKTQLLQRINVLSAELQKVRDNGVREAEQRRAMQRQHDDTTKTISVEGMRRGLEETMLSSNRQQSVPQPKQPMRSGADRPQPVRQPQGVQNPYAMLAEAREHIGYNDRPQQAFVDTPVRQPQGARPPYAFMDELKGRSGSQTYEDRTDDRRQRVQQQEIRFGVQSQMDDNDGTRALMAQLEESRKYLQNGK